ncbi:MAG TPA: aminotransferase class V-fold PLP-dependent enzyme [Gammaproteobacteria bacterium]|nr:aminotransferase class V-fold PLP-dependent enzyme [Gammaproteobacteria bacterium]
MLTLPSVDVESLRRREFPGLKRQGLAYLDYTGAALPPASLLRRDFRRLLSGVRGNPHSVSVPSLASTESIERARRLTLAFVGADPAVYDVVFTANATGAMRIVAEGFPFGRGSRLVLAADNHNSVNGLAEPAWKANATVAVAPLADDLRAADPMPWLEPPVSPSLFAFAAQSNFSGVRHPLQWVRAAQSRGYRVLLDAAAYVPTARLDLSTAPADFVALSFYKVFGYPTGVGALVARRDALAELERRYFGGGTVDAVSLPHRVVHRKPAAEAFEDGTANFLAMDAVGDGIAWMDGLGREAVAAHGARLTRYLLETLAGFGDRVVVYGPREHTARGGTVAFNVRRRGAIVPYEEVEDAARRRAIAIRGGCFCNPGAAAAAFGFDTAKTGECLRRPFSVEALRRCMPGKAVGAVRASVGLATTEDDVDRLGELVAAMIAHESARERAGGVTVTQVEPLTN